MTRTRPTTIQSKAAVTAWTKRSRTASTAPRPGTPEWRVYRRARHKSPVNKEPTETPPCCAISTRTAIKSPIRRSHRRRCRTSIPLRYNRCGIGAIERGQACRQLRHDAAAPGAYSGRSSARSRRVSGRSRCTGFRRGFRRAPWMMLNHEHHNHGWGEGEAERKAVSRRRTAHVWRGSRNFRRGHRTIGRRR